MAETKRILIVDDEATVLWVLNKTLSTLDRPFEIAVARSGRRALQKTREKPIDLLITDLKMPDLDGVELTEAVRSENGDTVVVWITAYGCHRVYEEGKRLGVFRCLDKPLKIGDLRRAALEALNGPRPA